MTRKIPLCGKDGKGRYALVDDADYERLSQYKWWVNGGGYAVRYKNHTLEKGKYKRLYFWMHREVAQIASEHEVDHIDNNRLNNCRDNLRQATSAQNKMSKPKARYAKETHSQYKGVTRHVTGRWHAYISKDGRRISLGYYDDEVDAALAYDKAAERLFGEYAWPNFPLNE